MNRFYLLFLIVILSCSSNRKVNDRNNLNIYRGEITQISKSENDIFYKSSCSGIVIDHESKESLPYVNIRLSSVFKSYAMSSDSSGIFNFSQLNSGSYKIEFYYLGYYPFVDSLLLEIGKNTNIQVDLYVNPNSILGS